MPGGYDNLMQTVARQQATIDRLLAQVTDSQSRLAELQAQIDEHSDLRLRLVRAEDRADTAQRAAEDATRRATVLETQSRDATAGDRATAATLVRLEALVMDLTSRPAPNIHADISDLFTRLSRIEDTQGTAVARADTAQRSADSTAQRLAHIEEQIREADAAQRANVPVLARLNAQLADISTRPEQDIRVDMEAVFARIAQLENAHATAAGRIDERLNQVTAVLLRDVGTVRATANTAQVLAEQTRAALDAIAGNLAADIAAVDARRSESEKMPDGAVDNVMRAVDAVAAQFWQDPVLATSRSMGGLQVPDTAILGLAATKLTNLVTAWNAQTGYSAASVTTGTLGASVVVSGANVSTGDVPQAQMQTNVIGAVNAVGTGMSAAVVTTGSLGSGRMSANVMAAVTASGNDLALGAGQKAGFYGTTPPAQQSVTVLTNNVTSGGSANTISDYSDLSVYANDSATIRNNLYRLGEQVNLLRTAVRNYGLLS